MDSSKNTNKNKTPATKNKSDIINDFLKFTINIDNKI